MHACRPAEVCVFGGAMAAAKQLGEGGEGRVDENGKRAERRRSGDALATPRASREARARQTDGGGGVNAQSCHGVRVSDGARHTAARRMPRSSIR